MNIISSLNRQIARWRFDAKQIHGYTDAELAKKMGCSVSALTHKSQYYRMPVYQVERLKDLANAEKEK